MRSFFTLFRCVRDARIAPSAPNEARAIFAAAALFAVGAAGCTPVIGDLCSLSTDCSISGDRLCDTSQPGGYCTVFDCRGDSCPDYAACVLFHANVQGCGYDDRAVSRTGRTFCMAQCTSNSDCRDGYMCTDPRQPPWNALILDDVQGQLVCIVRPDDGVVGPQASVATVDAAVCSPNPPPYDASFPPPDASHDTGVDTGRDTGLDTGIDASLDASLDASADARADAGVDAGADAATDAATDAAADAADAADAGAPDAPAG